MSSKLALTLHLRFRWWFKPAIHAVYFAKLVGLVRNAEPFISWIARKGTIAVVE